MRDDAMESPVSRPEAPVRRTARALWAGALLLAACADAAPRPVSGGDPGRGPALIRGYSCHACHLIPGVEGADGLVGPPLIHWRNRVYIAGVLPNRPENLIRWIMDPQSVDERTAMPDMGVTEEHARHIAAYLYTLR